MFLIRFSRSRRRGRGNWWTPLGIFEAAWQESIYLGMGLQGTPPDGQGTVDNRTDPYGRVLATTDNRAVSDPVMVVQVPTQRVFTLYAIIGDLFGWLSVAGLAAIAVLATLRGRRLARA